MNERELKAFEDKMHSHGTKAVLAVDKYLYGKGATSVYARVVSHFNFGGELCDGPYALLKASFVFTKEDLEKLLDDELTSITIKRYDVPGFNDGTFQGVATLMYSYKEDKAYFFGG